MRYLLISTEDNSKKYVEIPKEMIKDQKPPKNTIKRKVNVTKKTLKNPIKRLNKRNSLHTY